MRIIDNRGIWSMETCCLGNDPELEVQKGCFTKLEVFEDDIELVECEIYNMFGRPYSARVELFMITCPNCGKQTVISSKSIPEEIKNNIRETHNITMKKEFKRKW